MLPVNKTFSFTKRTDVVPVTRSTTHYILEGTIEETPDEFSLQEITVARDLTTAINKTHFKLPENMRMFASDNKSSINITLLPENIDKEVQIAFTTYHKPDGRDYSKYIDTIIVKLVPEL